MCFIANREQIFQELDVTFMPQYSNSDVATILLQLNGEAKKNIILSSIYLHGSLEEIPGSLVKSIIKYTNESGLPLIMGGDVNAHHTV